MNELVASLEGNLIERFQELAGRLRGEHQNVVVSVTSFDEGQRTPNSRRTIAIECLFTDAPTADSNNVGLIVVIEHLNARSRLSAHVGWGDPSGYVEDEFRPEPVQLSSETLQELYAALPTLCKSFESSVVRRKPST